MRLDPAFFGSGSAIDAGAAAGAAFGQKSGGSCKWRGPMGYPCMLNWLGRRWQAKIVEELFRGRNFIRELVSCACAGIFGSSLSCETW